MQIGKSGRVHQTCELLNIQGVSKLRLQVPATCFLVEIKPILPRFIQYNYVCMPCMHSMHVIDGGTLQPTFKLTIGG